MAQAECTGDAKCQLAGLGQARQEAEFTGPGGAKWRRLSSQGQGVLNARLAGLGQARQEAEFTGLGGAKWRRLSSQPGGAKCHIQALPRYKDSRAMNT